MPRVPLPVALLAFVLAAPAPAQAPADTGRAARWDVSRPFGPVDTLRFEATEGTWMNVDVSPDGRTLVFDHLGDLYTLPVAGGAARRLTGGLAFDMQPRFSPDGRLIAFISDRDGLNNIWVMRPDGSGLRQVSKEAAQDVNSPAWSPDGQYLFARKHFVEQRSLGAGEVWMWHVSGGAGLKVTDRGQTWQKDAGEPALSPDGRYLYYSKDVTPGLTFDYNRDPYAGIYAILRRDLADGTERTVAGGPGGAITPRVSPDGRTLALIRRVRLRTVLHLRDLATGAERPVWDGLDRDMQETWAVQGVYPQYAWMPDGTALVIWAGGGLWRVDAAGGGATRIPFTVAVEQVVHRALRFPQRISDAAFPVRMLRHVTTAPDGRAVAFTALGRVYLRPLPSGEPRPLTRDDALESHPAFSPDGRWVAYAAWTDAGRGRVRVARADGGPGARDVVTVPGHYLEPAFSPDGRWLVYRALTGDGIRGPTHGEEPGIWVVPADGGAPPRLVTREGTAPRFDPTGARILLRGTESGKQLLYSVNLLGGDRIVHFRSDNATEIVASPDGRWVAFAERYRAWVAPFPQSGRPVDIGPATRTHPVARISGNAGIYLHWSADSRRVHWALGPEYFTRDLGRTFAFVDGGQEQPAQPEAAGLAIGFTAAEDRPEGVVALTGARVITMEGADGGVIENGTVVVTGNRITAVGPAGRVAVPAGAHRVDVTGRTIIPGLVDVHAHVGGESGGLLAQASWPLLANLAFGVTTMHDPSNATETVFANSEMLRAGRKLGPRLFSTGTILYGAETPSKAVVETPEDARAHLARMKAVGAFSVKSYNQRRRDARQMLVQAARELEMMVVPEGGSLVYANMTMVNDGHTGIEHALPVPKVYADLATLMGRSGTGYTPTIIVGYGGIWGENYWYERTDVWENRHLLAFTPREVVDARARRRLKAAEEGDWNHVDIARGGKAVLDAGGHVLLGAHGQVQGLGVHWELWMLRQGGMTPLEALRAATLHGAWYLGLDGEIGSLREGKLADLAVIDGDPLADIRQSERVVQVMLNGRLYDARTLHETAPRARPRPALWWER
jgi:Tol biopolymer transport system component/imidazolonepropionase-like amidohydrolase